MSAYDDTIYSERLLKVQRKCSECDEPLHPTGYLKHFSLPGPSLWGIEYKCLREREVFVIHDAALDPLIQSIIREAGKI